jgi:MFS family permease
MPSDKPPHLSPSFNRLAWSNLAAQSAEQIALAAAPIAAVLLLGVGEGQSGLLQTALTLPFVVFAIPAGLLADRFPRRWLMAGAEATRATALVAILLLIGSELLTLPRLATLGFHRRMRNSRLQRGRARAGALAGVAGRLALGPMHGSNSRAPSPLPAGLPSADFSWAGLAQRQPLVGGIHGAESCLYLAAIIFAAQALVILLSPAVALARQPDLATEAAKA